ncbi:MAG: biopolymer transporter ExbD [Victivallales bacterium]|nr:biopolymer transporter ExbD [Victivallales bacterium]
MGRYLHNQRKTAINIDITPLMDLTFMLLIIFIITVPAMEYSTDVTPPSMETPKTVEDVKDKVVVSLDKEGTIKVDNKIVPKGELIPVLKAVKDSNVLIISDGSRRYEEVIEIHRLAYHAGVKSIYLVTRAENVSK